MVVFMLPDPGVPEVFQEKSREATSREERRGEAGGEERRGEDLWLPAAVDWSRPDPAS